MGDATMKTNRKRRKNHVINPSFQWKYAGCIAANVFAMSSVLGVVLFAVMEQLTRWRLTHLETPHVARTVQVLLGFALLFGALAAGMFAIWSIFITHRLCGPLHVISGALSTLRHGGWPKLRSLRKKDELKAFYNEFRETVDTLREKRRQELAHMMQLLRAAGEPAGNGGSEPGPKLEIVRSHLETICRAMALELNEDIGNLVGSSSSNTAGERSAEKPQSREEVQA